MSLKKGKTLYLELYFHVMLCTAIMRTLRYKHPTMMVEIVELIELIITYPRFSNLNMGHIISFPFVRAEHTVREQCMP